ncbi:NrdR family transcriptional regulator [Streptomyces sp. NPDC002346]
MVIVFTMQCPSCATPSHVVAVEAYEHGSAVRRHRMCSECGLQFVTWALRADQGPALRYSRPIFPCACGHSGAHRSPRAAAGHECRRSSQADKRTAARNITPLSPAATSDHRAQRSRRIVALLAGVCFGPGLNQRPVSLPQTLYVRSAVRDRPHDASTPACGPSFATSLSTSSVVPSSAWLPLRLDEYSGVGPGPTQRRSRRAQNDCALYSVAGESSMPR